MEGYRVYAGSSPDDLLLVAEIEDPYTMTYSFSDLEGGPYYFYVTTIDSSGVESAPSDTVTITL
jgi:fibronectin type 3 domain-containing protein